MLLDGHYTWHSWFGPKEVHDEAGIADNTDKQHQFSQYRVLLNAL